MTRPAGRLVVGVSGASGMPLIEKLLTMLHTHGGVEVHLIISTGAERVLEAECGRDGQSLKALAHRMHDASDIAAAPASGSWRNRGMIICPCSMSSLASIASGAGMNLIHRAADVTLKERRPLIIVSRETPVNLIHAENMCRLIRAGATIMPFAPAFYTRPRSLDDILTHFCGRVLDQLGITVDMPRWGDEEQETSAAVIPSWDDEAV